MKALILENKVVQKEQEEFEVSPPLVWVDIPDGVSVKENDTYQAGVFVAKPAPVVSKIQKRVMEYEKKGWSDPYSLIDDILERGIDAVKKDREDIKKRFPLS